MSRELKFRAWNGRAMEYGGFAIHATGSVMNMAEGLSNVLPSAPIMQFTGLHDKNGVEIYEGDVVYAHMNDSKYVVEHGDFVDASSDCDGDDSLQYGWYVRRISRGTQEENLCQSDALFAVIGNIHQNPELLTTP